MKKILAFLLLLTIVTVIPFSTVGCGDGGSNPPTTSYTVSYDCKGGRPKVSDTYFTGRIFSPTPPSATLALTGYTFTGWYYDSACTRPYDYKNPQITSNITLYAGWSNIHKINFFTDTNQEIAAREVAYGQTVALADLPVPDDKALGSKEYEFDYWMNMNTQERISEDIVMNTMDINLFAVYKTGLSQTFAISQTGEYVASKANSMTLIKDEALVNGVGSVEVDMTLTSGVGWAGIAFQISPETAAYDAPFSQSDVYHYAFVILPGTNGATQIVKRNAGSYDSCSTGWGMTSGLKNTEYRKKYEAYSASGEAETFRLKVVITATRIEGYIDGELVCFATPDRQGATGVANQSPTDYIYKNTHTAVGLISQKSGVRFNNFVVAQAA